MRCEVKEYCKYRDAGCEDDHILLITECKHKENIQDIIQRQIRHDSEQRRDQLRELSELSINQPYAKHFLDLYFAGQITYEQCLVKCLIHTLKYNNEIMHGYLEMQKMARPAPIIFPNQ